MGFELTLEWSASAKHGRERSCGNDGGYCSVDDMYSEIYRVPFCLNPSDAKWMMLLCNKYVCVCVCVIYSNSQAARMLNWL